MYSDVVDHVLGEEGVRGHCPSEKNLNPELKNVISIILGIKKSTFCHNFHWNLCNLQAIPDQSECFVVERSCLKEANSEIEGSHFKTTPSSSPCRLVTHSFESPREIQTQEPAYKLNGGKRSDGQR